MRKESQGCSSQRVTNSQNTQIHVVRPTAHPKQSDTIIPAALGGTLQLAHPGPNTQNRRAETIAQRYHTRTIHWRLP